MNVDTIVNHLHDIADPSRLEKMRKYGIMTSHALGISVPELRAYAKQISKNHDLALLLWDTGIHEARILACYIDDRNDVTESQLEQWVVDFNSWDLCDQCCSNLIDKTSFAYEKAIAWSHRSEEFVKRAGFVLMACLAVHDKKASDTDFEQFFNRISDECNDARVYVKKAVNWALRQIGKRNMNLNRKAIGVSQQIQKNDAKTAQWIAGDALRELTSEKIQYRLQQKKK